MSFCNDIINNVRTIMSRLFKTMVNECRHLNGSSGIARVCIFVVVLSANNIIPIIIIKTKYMTWRYYNI